jgi:hypothetical protein
MNKTRQIAALAGTSLLLVAMIFSHGQPSADAAPGFAATNTPRPSSMPTESAGSVITFPIVNAADAVTTITTTTAGAAIHTEPNVDSETIGMLNRGGSLPVVGQVSVESDVWYMVETADGVTGWVAAREASQVLRWRSQIETFDGVEMVRVPAGCFVMGSEGQQDNESPAHTQCIDEPFWIDRYAVSNRQYGSSGYFSGDTRPREMVNWFDASAHCESRGARLPTEAEWEYAARGPLNRVYPWGDEFVDANVVSSWRTTARITESVGSRPGGISWVGAYNMSGNVWEWTATLYAPYPYDPDDGREDPDDTTGLRVVRGGSCCSYVIADVRAAYRFAIDPRMEDANIGFRCARLEQPGES